MNRYYDIEGLTNQVSERILNSDNSEQCFGEGNELEVLTANGKDLVKEKAIEIIEEDLEKAQDESRKFLLKKQTYMLMRKKLDLKKEKVKEFDEKIEELQKEYQKSYNKIREIRKYLLSMK